MRSHRIGQSPLRFRHFLIPPFSHGDKRIPSGGGDVRFSRLFPLFYNTAEVDLEKKSDYCKTSVNLPIDLVAEIKASLALASVRNTTDFIIRAIRFYISYLHADGAATFYTNTLYAQFDARLSRYEHRTNAALFKIAVAINQTMYLIAMLLRLSRYDLTAAHDLAMRATRSANGALFFEDIHEDMRTREPQSPKQATEGVMKRFEKEDDGWHG